VPSLPDLDEGETACIRIAIAHRQESLLLSDFRISPEVIQTVRRRVGE
jgi:predicted nucleic acid-binding protein